MGVSVNIPYTLTQIYVHQRCTQEETSYDKFAVEMQNNKGIALISLKLKEKTKNKKPKQNKAKGWLLRCCF